jgi:hypothetical protein
MIFFLILLASRPQQYNPIGLACFSFFKTACGFNYIIIISFSATKKSNEFTKFTWQQNLIDATICFLDATVT